MALALDPTVRLHLQNHLINIAHKPQAKALTIGTKEQLSAVVKISSSEKIDQSFGFDGKPQSYPNFGDRKCLVACIDTFFQIKVLAIYTLKQMQEVDGQKNSPFIKIVRWKVLEISEELEADLLKEVDLQNGLIFTSPEAFFGKEFKRD